MGGCLHIHHLKDMEDHNNLILVLEYYKFMLQRKFHFPLYELYLQYQKFQIINQRSLHKLFLMLLLKLIPMNIQPVYNHSKYTLYQIYNLLL